MIARYTVTFDREIGEQDGDGLYHDGTRAKAIDQLRKEIQEACDAGLIVGSFNIADRITLEP